MYHPSSNAWEQLPYVIGPAPSFPLLYDMKTRPIEVFYQTFFCKSILLNCVCVTQGHYVKWQLKFWSVGTGRLEDLALIDRAISLVNHMTAGNTRSLVIDSLYDPAGDENIAVADLYCHYLAQRR